MDDDRTMVGKDTICVVRVGEEERRVVEGTHADQGTGRQHPKTYMCRTTC